MFKRPKISRGEEYNDNGKARNSTKNSDISRFFFIGKRNFFWDRWGLLLLHFFIMTIQFMLDA
jgi:hypothetical protein